jgi:hypothetical protein
LPDVREENNASEDSRSTDRNFELGPPEYEAGVVVVAPQGYIIVLLTPLVNSVQFFIYLYAYSLAWRSTVMGPRTKNKNKINIYTQTNDKTRQLI